jgi:hypothetical protein
MLNNNWALHRIHHYGNILEEEEDGALNPIFSSSTALD